MSTPRVIEDEQSKSKRPPHLSIASLGTNASGIADSTISNTSDFSGISQFPSPPTEVPTPTLSNLGTPTSYNFAERLPPSIPDYETPTRFQFGTPPTSRSPVIAVFANNSSGHDVQSLGTTATPKAGRSNTEAKVSPPPAAKLATPKEHQVVGHPPKPPFPLPSQSSSSSQTVRPLALRKNPLPHPPVTTRALEKRPETPYSVTAASSLLDWSDAASGISINPSEERLLSTSFITSLLSQSPEPFLGDKVSNASSRSARQRYNGRGRITPESSLDERLGAAAPPHQSIPPFYPSDLLTADDREVVKSGAKPGHDQRSIELRSNYALTEQSSETLHTIEGQVHSVVRRSIVGHTHGGIEARPVAVVPAYRISYGMQIQDDTNNSLRSVNNSMATSASMASKPPVHHADAPQNVRNTKGFDRDNLSRESEDNISRQAEASSSPGMPGFSTRNPLNRVSNAIMNSKSGLNEGPSSRHYLQRNQSMKSVVSSLVSRISNTSVARRAKYVAWLRQRPLPPLPIASNPPPMLANSKEIQKFEESIPLPTLAKRAEDLLDRSRFQSVADKDSELYYKEAFDTSSGLQSGNRAAYVQISQRGAGNGDDRFSILSRFRRQKGGVDRSSTDTLSAVKVDSAKLKRRKHRLWILIICTLIGVILAIAVPVGLAERSRNSAPVCKGNSTGAACTLDATCKCTGSGGTCKPLAASLSILLPQVNQFFSANFTPSGLSDAVVSAVGPPIDGLCREQVALIDVEPGINSAAAPNRTAWAQAAMLWNLGLSEDASAARDLQEFVSSAPWNTLSAIDGPVEDSNGAFVKDVSGFSFDFAAQSVTPLSASFKQSSPSSEQLAEVSDTTEKALDRMYTYAIASSTQRQKALQNYWTSVLQQQVSDLQKFRDAVQNAPFLIPFDSTSSPGGDVLTTQMSNASSTQFPIPISCYPGLNSTQMALINSLEINAFGLTCASTSSQFSQSCFPDRPVYGVVDFLRLRLPFPDDRKGVALQASALSTDATVRTVVYSGEILSALPGTSAVSDISSSMTDPREFGTPDFLDHVLLNYFSSMSNTSLAMDLVSYVLSSSTTPPANNSDLANSLSSLPVLEFAVFGSIRPQDIAFSVSSFSTPSDSLFFGSDVSEVFRSWALVNTSASVVWTESALSPDAVHETSTIDPNFESVWKPASELAASGSTDAEDVQKVTSSLRSLGLFSS